MMWSDLRFGVRVLWKQRAFTAVAVVTLALAMGMGDTVYAIVNAMILRGLPVPHPDRLVIFNDRSPKSFPLSVSYRDVADFRERTSSFAEIALWTSTTVTVGDEGRAPEVVSGSYVSTNIFRLVEQPPLVGRDFLPSDEQPGAAPVAILGYTVWASRYGSDKSIVGKTVRLNDKPATVVGVMPPGFRFPLVDDIWLPVSAMPTLNREKRDARPFRACGRLRDGVSLSRTNVELTAATERLAHEYPSADRTVHAGVMPFTGTASYPMYQALFGAVACLLLIACANVSNLLLARSERRAHEIAIRIAIGASRWRVIRQLAVESAIVAALAGAFGFLLSIAGVKVFAYAVQGINFPYWYRDRWTMDYRVFAFTAATCLTTAFAFGSVPAAQLARRDVQDRLKHEGRTVGGGASHVWANALLAGELTVALMLLTAAGLMVASFLAEYRADLRADAAHVLTASLRPPPAQTTTPAQRLALYRRIEERLRSTPGLAAATFASTPPYIGGPMYDIAFDEHRPAAEEPARRASFVAIDVGYFETLGVRLLRGRAFADEDGVGGHEAAIVNQQFVDAVLGGRDPLQQRVCAFSPDNRTAPPSCAPIVGVSPTVRQQFMGDLDPVIYFPLRANAGAAMLLVRSADIDAAATAVRTTLRMTEPDTIVWRLMPLQTWMEQSRWGYRVFGTMFGVFAAVALALSAVGIYAVTAYSVVERTREIGIRMALGADAARVVLLFVRRKAPALAVGLALGFGGAFAVGRLMRNMLVQIGPADPATLASVAALLVVVACCAVLLPAIRAARLEAVDALRHP